MTRPTQERLEEIRTQAIEWKLGTEGSVAAVELLQEIDALRAERDAYKKAKEENDERFQTESQKLRTALQDAIEVIGDGDNGPPRHYAELFHKLEEALK